jgi:hypothetical protein
MRSQAYENLGTIGEGTFGVVAKCRHRPTGAQVAVKMFKDFDKQVWYTLQICPHVFERFSLGL